MYQVSCIKVLPAGFLDSGNVSFEGFLAEADAAKAEITHEAAWAAALEAATDDARREFRLAVRLYDHALFSHRISPKVEFRGSCTRPFGT